MNKLIKKVSKPFRLLVSLFPTALPVGMTAFNAWADDIIDLYSFPNNDSIKFSLASMVMHLGPTTAFKPKFHFFLMVRSGMSKQIAAATFQEIKNKQEALAKAAQEAATNENEQQGIQSSSS